MVCPLFCLNYISCIALHYGYQLIGFIDLLSLYFNVINSHINATTSRTAHYPLTPCVVNEVYRPGMVGHKC